MNRLAALLLLLIASSAGAVTNYVAQTETLDNATWTKDGTTVTANTTDTVSPRGDNTAEKIIETATTAQHRLFQSITVGALGPYTWSAFAKAGTVQFLSIYPTGLSGVTFQLSGAGTVTANGGAPFSNQTITALSNGWYRCSFTITTSGGQFATLNIGSTSTGATTAGEAGSTGNYLYLWGINVTDGTLGNYLVAVGTVPNSGAGNDFSGTATVSIGMPGRLRLRGNEF